MEFFVQIVNGLKLRTIFKKISILDIWHGSGYASAGVLSAPLANEGVVSKK